MLKNQILKTGLFVLVVVALSSFSIHISLAEESPLPKLNTKTRTIALFKNGLGFFIRDGETTLKDGWAETEYVPNAALGSLWIGVLDKDAELEEVVGFKEDIAKEGEAISIEELIKVNVGKEVTITLGDKTIEGKIKSAPEDIKLEKKEPLTSNYQRDYYYTQPPVQSKLSSSIVVIETADGEVALNKGSITNIRFPKDINTKFIRKEEAKRMKFRVATKKNKIYLRLAYLQKGISWIPGYLVNIEDSRKARITMQAEIINDIEDLENIGVSFVVGYPNFVFADILSPMAMEESLTQFIRTLNGDGSRRTDQSGILANRMRQSASLGLREETSGLDYSYSEMKGLSGESEEDFFLYNKQGVNLKKGERAYYHIFSEEVEYKHIYEWEIADTITVKGYSYRFEQEKKEKEAAWHSIRLTNSTAYPWTTAPAFAISSSNPLAQDIIDYTPKGTTANLRLTMATDVKTDKHEYETGRQRDIILYGYHYDLVTVKGELYIKNCKDESIDMEIKKKVTGEVIDVSHNGKTKKIAEGLQGTNSKSNILWKLPLKASEEVNITYQYKVYISR